MRSPTQTPPPALVPSTPTGSPRSAAVRSLPLFGLGLLGMLSLGSVACNSVPLGGNQGCVGDRLQRSQQDEQRPQRDDDPGWRHGRHAVRPNGEGSTGVKLDPTATSSSTPAVPGGQSQSIIWVANSTEGTVSNRHPDHESRWRAMSPSRGGGDPSRTTVSLGGDVVVANRARCSTAPAARRPRR